MLLHMFFDIYKFMFFLLGNTSSCPCNWSPSLLFVQSSSCVLALNNYAVPVDGRWQYAFLILVSLPTTLPSKEKACVFYSFGLFHNCISDLICLCSSSSCLNCNCVEYVILILECFLEVELLICCLKFLRFSFCQSPPLTIDMERNFLIFFN